MRTRTLNHFAVLLAMVVPACATEGNPDDNGSDRVTISNDEGDLARNVTRRNDPVEVEPAGMPNGLVLAPRVDWTLTLVAEVAPPEIDGVALQATAVSFRDGMAVVSYNMAGVPQQGAVDVFTFDEAHQPTLTARALFADADVHAVEAVNGQVWMATGTADETFGTPAVLEVMGVSPTGELSLEGHQRVGLSSYAATSVCVRGDRVYATSGNTGGVFAFDRLTLTPTGATALDDARWAGVADDGRVVVVQGTPGRVTVLTGGGLLEQAQYGFDGAYIPESKSTVEVLGGKAFVAAGPGGTYVIDISTGAELAHIGLPTDLPLPLSEIVTNAVSVDGDLMFVSNGAAGVYLVQASDSLAKPVSETPPTFQVAGRLGLDGSASVNHITYKDGFLFVATGLGGLKIVKVEPAAVVVEPPTGYPYASDLETANAQAGWVFSGDWGFGALDGERAPHSGAVFIDNNPSRADQYNHATDNIALLDVPLAIPTEGSPSFEFWYSLGDLVHVNDAFYVEVENPSTGKWDTKRTLTTQYARTDYAFAQVPLDAYKGMTVRVRLRQRIGKEVGARRFVVDDVRVGELTAPALGWPYATSFDSQAEQAQWGLEGAWHLDDDAHDGPAALSVNPEGASQSAFSGHAATLLGFVPVPAAETTEQGVVKDLWVLGFWYRSDLTHDNDMIDVDVQVLGETTWRDLSRFKPVHDHLGWSYDEYSLATYAGKSIRVRLSQSFGASDAPRTFVLDQLYLGPLGGAAATPTLAYPYGNAFETGEELAQWALAGQWASSSDAHGGAGALDANPAGVVQSGYGAGQDATMTGFVTLPESGPVALTFQYRLGLADPADRAYVDIQSQTDGTWRNLVTFQAQHSRDTWSELESRLDAWHGQSVRLRLRFSYAHTADVRTFVVDDLRIDGLPEARYAWPYRATFGDETALADWALNGSFQVVTDAEAGAMLDANPYAAPQANQSTGHQAMMRGFVQLPETGRLTLTVALRFALTDPDDKIYLWLQTADGGGWDRVRTYDTRLNHPSLGHDEISLAPWAGHAVRLRISYAFKQTELPRTLQVADVAFGPLVLDSYPFPYRTSFESDDTLADWNLWGSWAVATAHDSATPYSGAAFLDGNPFALVQNNYKDLQTATMNGYVALPNDVNAHAGLSYRFDVADASDRLELELHTADADSDDWTPLLSIRAEHARGGLASVDVPLGPWAGQSIRLRLRQVLYASEAPRTIVVDDLWIDALADQPLAFPYAVDFAAPTSDWAFNGTWAVTADGWLSSNPGGLVQSGYTIAQTATLDGFVDLAGVAVPALSCDYRLLLAHTSDRAYIEVQGLTDAAWTKVKTLTRSDNSEATKTATVSLAAFAGAKVRVRFRYTTAASDQGREFAVQHVTIGGAL